MERVGGLGVDIFEIWPMKINYENILDTKARTDEDWTEKWKDIVDGIKLELLSM